MSIIPAFRFTTRIRLCVACAQKHAAARSISSSTAPWKDKSKSSSGTTQLDQQDNEQWQIRLAATRERIPNYAGWWTSILNEHRPPQSMPDPSLNLEADHVFQGTIAPKGSESKQATNTLPTTTTVNTLPSAQSRAAEAASTLESSLSTASHEAKVYHGFKIPVKPSPPGAEDCCMSGCAHCIYDIYEEDRQDYKAALAKVLEAIQKAGLPPPPPDVVPTSATKTSGSNNNDNSDDDDMDPGMKAFLELERKLKG